MKFYITYKDYVQVKKREISEAVYTAIATASSEKANEIVRNVLGGYNGGWSLVCE